jgi:NTP pyrophosphatase (non-canonical NTP hydrolase)
MTKVHWDALREIAKECWKISDEHGWHEPDKVLSDSAAAIRRHMDFVGDSAEATFIDICEMLEKKAKDPDVMGKLTLIHAEVSEAVEAFRNPLWDIKKTYVKGPEGSWIEADVYTSGKPEGLGSELADVVIRAFDLAGILGIDIATEIHRKMTFNRSRPHRHGGKRC